MSRDAEGAMTASTLRGALLDVPDEVVVLVHIVDHEDDEVALAALVDASQDGTCAGPDVVRLTARLPAPAFPPASPDHDERCEGEYLAGIDAWSTCYCHTRRPSPSPPASPGGGGGAVQRVAEVLLRQYESEYDAGPLTWRDFEQQARECVVAATPPPPGGDGAREARERVAKWLAETDKRELPGAPDDANDVISSLAHREPDPKRPGFVNLVTDAVLLRSDLRALLSEGGRA